ncbi:MAG: heme A synthase [Actinobacteria bacterium]|nr:MAG: heme A synthase [Actinomycetota bacterium]
MHLRLDQHRALRRVGSARTPVSLNVATVRRRLVVSPALFARVSNVSLIALTAIVATGAAVRLTGSGLGCPDWPKCYGRTLPPLDTYAVIEYANRALSGLVGVLVVGALLAAWLRRPRRRDLLILSALLPAGVLAQAVLGGFTVREHLRPGFVMAHYGLSMLVLVAAVALAWRARERPREHPRPADAAVVWATRALLPLAALAVFAGTAATAAGPHAGGKPHQSIHRLTFMGKDTMDWTIHRHGDIAALLGVAAVVVWLFARQRGAPQMLRRSVGALCVLIFVQGVLGLIQYATQLPTELVWLHVTLATLTWLGVLWSVAAAGRLAPRSLGQARRLAASGEAA